MLNNTTPSAFAFETDRLRMRPLRADDEALFLDLYTDAETMRYIGEPLSLERAKRSLRKLSGVDQRVATRRIS